MSAILVLLFHHVRKSFQTIFLGFILPIILLMILMAIMGTLDDRVHKLIGFVVPALCMSVAPILGIVSLASSYADLKNSIVIKRIGATPLKNWQFITCVILFYTFLILIGIFWVLSFGSAVYHQDIHFEFVNWGYLILAALLIAIMSSIFGLMIGIVANDSPTANALGFVTYIPTAFLSGQYIPYFIFSEKSSLAIIAKIIPFSYPVSIMNRAWNHFNSTDWIAERVSMIDNYWIPIVVSFAWIIGLVGVVSLLYRFRRK